MALFLQIQMFFILIAVGCIARRIGVITRENQPQLSALAMNIVCIVIDNYDVFKLYLKDKK